MSNLFCKRILPLFKLCLWWLHSSCLLQSDIWWLTTARRSSYQSVLVRIYCNRAIVEARFPFMTCRICILRTLLSGWSFVFKIYANCGAIAVIASMTYMTVMELFDEYPAPFSPEVMMIVIEHDPNIWHNIINENRKKHQSTLLRGIGPGPGPSFLTWWLRNPIRVPRG